MYFCSPANQQTKHEQGRETHTDLHAEQVVLHVFLGPVHVVHLVFLGRQLLLQLPHPPLHLTHPLPQLRVGGHQLPVACRQVAVLLLQLSVKIEQYSVDRVLFCFFSCQTK